MKAAAFIVVSPSHPSPSQQKFLFFLFDCKGLRTLKTNTIIFCVLLNKQAQNFRHTSASRKLASQTTTVCTDIGCKKKISLIVSKTEKSLYEYELSVKHFRIPFCRHNMLLSFQVYNRRFSNSLMCYSEGIFSVETYFHIQMYVS